jgi:hypothetical protein
MRSRPSVCAPIAVLGDTRIRLNQSGPSSSRAASIKCSYRPPIFGHGSCIPTQRTSSAKAETLSPAALSSPSSLKPFGLTAATRKSLRGMRDKVWKNKNLKQVAKHFREFAEDRLSGRAHVQSERACTRTPGTAQRSVRFARPLRAGPPRFRAIRPASIGCLAASASVSIVR